MRVDFDLSVRHGKPCLIASDLEVRVGSFRAHADARAKAPRFRRLRLRPCGLRGPPQPAEQIQFPTRLSPYVVELLVAGVTREVLRNLTHWAMEGLLQSRTL